MVVSLWANANSQVGKWEEYLFSFQYLKCYLDFDVPLIV